MRRIKVSRVVANVTSNNYLAVSGNTIFGVALNSSNVTEGSNLYFTNTRAYANTLVAIKTGNGIAYSNITGNITLSATGVFAENYGNNTHHVGLVIDSTGRITSANSIPLAAGPQGNQGVQGSTGVGVQGAQGAQGVSGSGGGGGSYLTKTANYTAVAFDSIITNSSGGSFTITLPATPSSGDSITIADAGYWGDYPITVARNGNTIEGQSDNLLLDFSGVSVTLIYSGSTWQVITSLGKQGAQGATGSTFTTGKAIAMSIVFGG